MNNDIFIMRAPRQDSYVIVDNSGFPRSVPSWPDAVTVLQIIAMEDSSEIEAMKRSIDAGQTRRLRCREIAS
jgi:hypothetical protein